MAGNETPNQDATMAKNNTKAEEKQTADLTKNKGSGAFGAMRDFLFKYPILAMILLYIILTFLARFWSGATVIFMIIPLIACGIVWNYSRNLSQPIEGERHQKLFWWARVGLYSSISALISVFVLDFLNVIHVFVN